MRQTRHRPVFVHDFADHASGIETGDARDVDTGFCLSGTNEYAAVLGAQREDVTGTTEILWPRLRIDSDENGRGAISSGDSGRDAATGVDGNGEGCAEIRGVVCDLRGQVELVTTFFGERQADQTTGMPGHEVDDLGSDLLGGADQIAFVLAIFVVNDDDHAAVADVGNGLFNGR